MTGNLWKRLFAGTASRGVVLAPRTRTPRGAIPGGGALIAENSRYVNLTSAEMPYSGLGHQNFIFLHSDSLWSIHPSLTPRTASLYVRGTICSDEAVRVGTHPMTCFPWRPPPTLAAAHLFTTQTPGGMLGIEYVRGPAFRCKEIGGKYGPGFLASSPDQGGEKRRRHRPGGKSVAAARRMNTLMPLATWCFVLGGGFDNPRMRLAMYTGHRRLLFTCVSRSHIGSSGASPFCARRRRQKSVYWYQAQVSKGAEGISTFLKVCTRGL